MGLKAIANRAPVIVTFKVFAAEDTDQYVFTADRDYTVESIAMVLSAGDAAGTLIFEKVPSGTAIGSGTDLHGTAFDLNATADTPVTKTVANGGLVASVATRTVSAGQSIGADFGGTLNDTFQGTFTLVLHPVTGR